MNELESSEWFTACIEECKAIIVEGEFTARWTIIETYHELGKRILQEYDNFERSKIYGDRIVSQVAESLGKSERTIYRAMQFAREYPDLAMLPLGKNASWHSVCQLLPVKGEKKEKPVKGVTVECPKCGFVFEVKGNIYFFP